MSKNGTEVDVKEDVELSPSESERLKYLWKSEDNGDENVTMRVGSVDDDDVVNDAVQSGD